MTIPQAVYCCDRCGKNCSGGHCPTCATLRFPFPMPTCDCGWEPPRSVPVVVGRIEPAPDRPLLEDVIGYLIEAVPHLQTCRDSIGLAHRRDLARRMQASIDQYKRSLRIEVKP